MKTESRFRVIARRRGGLVRDVSYLVQVRTFLGWTDVRGFDTYFEACACLNYMNGGPLPGGSRRRRRQNDETSGGR